MMSQCSNRTMRLDGSRSAGFNLNVLQEMV